MLERIIVWCVCSGDGGVWWRFVLLLIVVFLRIVCLAEFSTFSTRDDLKIKRRVYASSFVLLFSKKTMKIIHAALPDSHIRRRTL